MVGRDRLPSLEDRPNLHYLQAVTHESQRISALAYGGIARIASKDTRLGGYDIPKGTRLNYAIYEMMNDPAYWEDPDKFRPERFMRAGKFQLDDRFIPFGIGRRHCMGKTLALDELFLFTTSFVQHFNFSFPPDYVPPDKLEPEVGVILYCPDYPIIFKER